MPKDIYEVLLNPVRVRIMQTLMLGSRETITANEICDLLSDIPRTTLYRHINVLIEANVLRVVAERKVRGSVERTLAFNAAEVEKLKDAEDIPALAFRFLMLTHAKFEKYFHNKDRKDLAAVTDTMFLRNWVLMLSDEEFGEFLSALRGLFEKYHFEESSGGRKPRDISIICAPPENDN